MNSKRTAVLGKLLLGVIPANEAVSYAHHQPSEPVHLQPEVTGQ